MLMMAVTRNLRAPSASHGTTKDAQLKEQHTQLSKQGVKGNRCFYCSVGFGHINDFEVVHHNDDHLDLAEANLKAGCELCHSIKHLDLIKAKSSDTGSVIYLPEMTQIELNQLFWAIVYHDASREAAQISPDDIGDKFTDATLSGQAVYLKLFARHKIVPKSLQNVSLLAQMLKKISNERYEARHTFLAGLRYLPPIEYYSKKIKDGLLHLSVSNISIASWSSLIDKG